MASEAAKMAVRGNMHMDPRVIEVVYFKSLTMELWSLDENLILRHDKTSAPWDLGPSPHLSFSIVAKLKPWDPGNEYAYGRRRSVLDLDFDHRWKAQ